MKSVMEESLFSQYSALGEKIYPSSLYASSTEIAKRRFPLSSIHIKVVAHQWLRLINSPYINTDAIIDPDLTYLLRTVAFPNDKSMGFSPALHVIGIGKALLSYLSILIGYIVARSHRKF